MGARDLPDDYTRAAALVDAMWAEFFKPPANLTVSQWADKNRMLSGKASSEPGPWRTDGYSAVLTVAETSPVYDWTQPRIAGKAVLDGNFVADRAGTAHALEENDFHFGIPCGCPVSRTVRRSGPSASPAIFA